MKGSSFFSFPPPERATWRNNTAKPGRDRGRTERQRASGRNFYQPFPLPAPQRNEEVRATEKTLLPSVLSPSSHQSLASGLLVQSALFSLSLLSCFLASFLSFFSKTARGQRSLLPPTPHLDEVAALEDGEDQPGLGGAPLVLFFCTSFVA